MSIISTCDLHSLLLEIPMHFYKKIISETAIFRILLTSGCFMSTYKKNFIACCFKECIVKLTSTL